jgi:hypothetical protein
MHYIQKWFMNGIVFFYCCSPKQCRLMGLESGLHIDTRCKRDTAMRICNEEGNVFLEIIIAMIIW